MLTAPVEPDHVRLIDPVLPVGELDMPPLAPVTDAGATPGQPPGTTDSVGPAIFTAERDWPADRVTFGFNLAKIEGKGEDADPLLLLGPDTALVAVFDGMGGAGGTVYQTPDGPHTGAYLASRITRDVVELVLQDQLHRQQHLDPAVLADVLRREIHAALADRVALLNAPRSGLRSTLIRTLPTTMSLALLQRQADDGATWTCQLFWAGDSRVYVIDPVDGVGQLTVDDIRDRGDALANLRADSVLSNAISADTPFTVNTRTVELAEPFLVVAATDGCFGYLASPMHFEHLLLSSLRAAADTEDWSNTVQRRTSEVTGDDAAMALVGIGADHDGFRSMFDERTNELENSWVRPLDGLRSDVERLALELDLVQTKHRETTAELWSAYQPSYERFQHTTRSLQEES